MASSEQSVYNSLFSELAQQIQVAGVSFSWEVRQEVPPQAYLHLSRPHWGDQHMNGIHFETYILRGELRERRAKVMLHCENGCPFQQEFMERMTERLRRADSKAESERILDSGYGKYRILGPQGCSVCELSVEFGASPEETVGKIQGELERLQAVMGPVVDDVIEECKKLRES
eukprot:TRINITY_DN112474_c0_g1_i1.p1 TRINITY_DN112474_c0_g1~~TRINITY_DN112474_c0_g1_i1.p1  ORF type:complete len:173 (-),score=25.46 TRINITY_DN112474_c0_g1_i1:37-555(-)